MIQTLFETPSTYRPTDAEMAAPVPSVEAVLFDFSNTIFQMIDLETWLRRVGAADLGTDPRATLMVGDNPVRDGGATACGLRTYILPAEHRTGDRGLADTLRLVGSR